MFAEERPFLKALPVEPFRYYQFGDRLVHLDGHVEVEAAYYSVPPGYISRRVWVQWDDVWVRILDKENGQLLREHLRELRGRFRTNQFDRPNHVPPKTLTLLRRADNAGQRIGILCREMHRRERQSSIRRILGIFSTGRKYGFSAVDGACAVAMEVGAPTYRFVRKYLEKTRPPMLSLKQVAPLIRELTHYRELINQRIKEQANESH